MANIIDLLCILRGRYILQLNINPILYFLSYLFVILHTWKTILLPGNQLIRYLKWFDISQHLNLISLQYFFGFLCFIFLLMTIFELYKSRQKQIKLSVIQKYSINIIGNIGFCLVTMLLLPLIRTCLLQIKNNQSRVDYLISMVTMIVFYFVVIPFNCLIIVDLSPVSNKIYSSLSFINYFRIIPFVRAFQTIDYCSFNSPNYYFVGITLGVSLITIFLFPFCNYRYDNVIKSISYATTWIMCIRTNATIQARPVPIGIILIGLPLFICTMNFINDKLMRRILNSNQMSVIKIKILVQLISNSRKNISYLAFFLLYHRQQCQDVQCKCTSIQKQFISGDNSQIWYELVIMIIMKDFSLKDYDSLPVSAKKNRLIQLVDMYLVYTNIISVKLAKWKTSLYYLEYFKSQIDSRGQTYFNFRSYYYQQIQLTERQLSHRCLQPDYINTHAQDFYYFNLHSTKLNQLVNKAAYYKMQFFKQIISQEPNPQRIISSVNRAYLYHQEIEKIYNLILINFQNNESIKFIYYSYLYSVCNHTETIKPSIPSIVNSIDEKIIHFHHNANTSMIVVSLSNNQTLGDIILVNKQFEKQTGFTTVNYLNVDHLLIEQQKYKHKQLMNKFIISQNLQVSGPMMVLTASKKIKKVNMIVQIIPSLVEGFRGACFIKKQALEGYFISNCKAEIIYYNQTFQSCVLSKLSNPKYFDLVFDEKILGVIISNKEALITIVGQSYKLKLESVISKNQSNKQNNGLFLVKVQFNNSNSQSATIALNDVKKLGQNLQKTSNFKEQKTIPKFENTALKKREIEKKVEQQLHNKKKLQKIFSTLIQNKPLKVSIWRITFFILIIGLIIIISFIISNGYSQRENFWSFFWQRHKYHRMMEYTQQALYYMRKANIQALTTQSNSSFNYYISQMIEYNSKAVKFFNNISIDVLRPTFNYKAFPNKTIIIEPYNLYFSLKESVYVSLTRLSYLNMSDFQIDFDINHYSMPLSKNQIHLLQAKLNGLITALPVYEQMLNDYIFYSNCQLGQCLVNQKIYFLVIISFICCGVIIIMSNWLITKYMFVKQQTYKLINKIYFNDIKNRYNSIQRYCKDHFQQLENSKIIKLELSNKLKLGHQIIVNVQENIQATIQPKPYTSKLQNFEDTQRQFQNIQQTEMTKTFPIQSVAYKNLKVPKNSKGKQFLCLLMIFFLLILFFVGVCIYTLKSSNSFRLVLKKHDILHERQKFIKYLKIYTLELGIDQGPYLKPQLSTISAKILSMINGLYAIERTIISQVIQGDLPSKNFVDYVTIFNNKNICDYLTIINPKRNLQASFTKAECQNIYDKDYLTQGLRVTIVNYIQQCRSLWIKYSNCLNCSEDIRMKSINQVHHKRFNKLGQYYQAIFLYIHSILYDDLLSMLIRYSQIILYISVSSIFLILIIAFIFYFQVIKTLKKNRKETKAVIHMVSQNIINSTNQIKLTMINQIKYAALE